MKKLLCIFISIALVFSLSGCGDMIGFLVMLSAANQDDRADKDDIFKFVAKNEDELREVIAKNDYTAFDHHKLVQDVTSGENSVEFYCGGAGFGSETAYVGFYYTPDNDMTAGFGAPASSDLLTPSGDGFEYREEFGDNYYYTEKICENFYYYEAEY